MRQAGMTVMSKMRQWRVPCRRCTWLNRVSLLASWRALVLNISFHFQFFFPFIFTHVADDDLFAFLQTLDDLDIVVVAFA